MAGVGAPQDLGDGPFRGLRPGVAVERAPRHGPPRSPATGTLPGPTPPARPGAPGGVRGPPARRNRVWQVDFSAFETTAEGAWALCPVVDYATKLALACPVTATQTAADLLGAFEAAIDVAEALLGRPLLEDLTDEATGEIAPLVIVSDNGPAMKSTAMARWFAARAHLAHVRTRHRAPWTNGVVERWIGTLQYERLYREEIPSGVDLAAHVTAFIDEYNTVRPNEGLAWRRPLDTYLTDPTLKPKPRKREQKC